MFFRALKLFVIFALLVTIVRALMDPNSAYLSTAGLFNYLENVPQIDYRKFIINTEFSFGWPLEWLNSVASVVLDIINYLSFISFNAINLITYVVYFFGFIFIV